MRDIVVDENAIYSYRPSESGSLAMYAYVDQNNRDSVTRFGYMNTMQLYHKEYGHRPDQSYFTSQLQDWDGCGIIEWRNQDLVK